MSNLIRSRKSRVSAVLATAAVSIGLVAAPAAQAQQNGLVNVQIGDITIQDVGVGVAANVLANVCGVQVNAAVLAQQVVRNDDPFEAVCTNEGNAPVTITQ